MRDSLPRARNANPATTNNSSKLLATPPSNASVTAAERKLLPSGDKVAAVELLRLANAYGVDLERWHRNAPEWIEAVKHVPPDLLQAAVSQLVRTSRSGEHLPRPGDILDLCNDDILRRQSRLDDAKHAIAGWPRWLAEIWGPAPEGPRNRAAALRAAEPP